MEVKPNNPEREYPTDNDLEELYIRVSSLSGRGDLIHEVSGLVTQLYVLMDKVKISGWTDILLNEWHQKSNTINKMVARIRLEK